MPQPELRTSQQSAAPMAPLRELKNHAQNHAQDCSWLAALRSMPPQAASFSTRAARPMRAHDPLLPLSADV
jgi:hypothetical protein